MGTSLESPAAVEQDLVDRRIAQRLARLRAERGWSLDALAERTGISRATLSRLERSELSPTASMLGKLCSVYGWTLSRLMAEAETKPPNLVPAAEQMTWTDPESGYRRRAVSPPAPGLRGELVEVHMPAGASVSFDASPIAGLEHHLWMLGGSLTLQVEGSRFVLRAGDCLRYVLAGSTHFRNTGTREARYIVAMVRP
jgi:transcriptional regulator with XRE-family HTH domain